MAHLIDTKFKAFVIQLLRKGTYRWKPRTEAYREARIARGLYKCAICGGTFKSNQVQLDHIQPVVDVKTGFVDWNTYIERMFCPKEGFQVLCRDICHEVKSSLEKGMRKEFRKLRKEKKK